MIYGREPGIISAAEESTAWPGVSRPTYLGGLGFGFKWNMGWMHDTLGYFQQDPIYRRYHHHELTFSLMYAFSENFILPLSHDEVVHGKGSLYTKMAGGDKWQKLANLRALYAYMWAHPGQEAAVHGLRDRPGAGVELRALARLAPARAARPRRHPVAGPRPEPASTRTSPRCGRSTRTRPGSGGWSPTTPTANVLAFARASQERRARGRVRRQPLAGAARRLPARPAARDALEGGAQHRLHVTTAAATWATSAGSTPSRSRGTASRFRRW